MIRNFSSYDEWKKAQEEKEKSITDSVKNGGMGIDQSSGQQRTFKSYDEWKKVNRPEEYKKEQAALLKEELERPRKEYEAKVQEFDTGLEQAKSERNFIQKTLRIPTKKEKELAAQKAEFTAQTYNKKYSQEYRDKILSEKPKEIKLSDEQYLSQREQIDYQLQYLNSVKSENNKVLEELDSLQYWTVTQKTPEGTNERSTPFLPTKALVAQANTYTQETDWTQAYDYLKKAAKESGMSEEDYAKSYNANISQKMAELYERVTGEPNSLTKEQIVEITKRTGIPAVDDKHIRLEIFQNDQYLDRAKSIYDEYTGVKEVAKVENLLKKGELKEGLGLVRDDMLSGNVAFLGDYTNQDMTGLQDVLRTKEIMRKLEAGEELTPNEKARIVLISALEADQQIDRGRLTRLFEGAADNIKLISEMALTAGVFSGASKVAQTAGKAVTKKVSYLAAKEMVEAAAEQGGKSLFKTMTSKGLKEGTKYVMQGVAAGLIAEIPETIAKDSLKIATEVIDSDKPIISFSDPETEEKFIQVLKNDESYQSGTLDKIAKAFARQYFNNALERGGGEVPDALFEAGTSRIKNALIAKYMSQKGIQTVDEFLRIYDAAGLDGMIGEVFEEYAQDYSESIIDNRDFVIDDPEKFWDIVASVGVMQMGRAGSVATTVVDVTSNIARGITFDTQQQTDQQVPAAEGEAPVDTRTGQDLDTLVTNTQAGESIQDDLQTKEILRQQQVSGETQTVLTEPVDDATLLSKAQALSDISKQTDYSLSSLKELKKLEKQATDEKTAQAIATISSSYADVLAKKVADGSVNIGQQIDTQLQDNIKEISPDETVQEGIKTTKQQILETPNKEYFVQEKGKFKEIKNAQTVKIINEADTFIYKDAESKLYQVVEAKSGMAIAEASTKSAAVEQATARLNKMGVEIFQNKIQEAIDKKGVSPRYVKKEVKKVVKKEVKTVDKEPTKKKEEPVKEKAKASKEVKKVSMEDVRKEAKEYPRASNFAYIANRKYGMSTEQATEIWNEVNKKKAKASKEVKVEEKEKIRTRNLEEFEKGLNLARELLSSYKASLEVLRNNPAQAVRDQSKDGEFGQLLVEGKTDKELLSIPYIKRWIKSETSELERAIKRSEEIMAERTKDFYGEEYVRANLPESLQEESPIEKAGLKIGSKIKVQGKLREVSEFGKSARDSQGVLVRFTDGTYITLDKAQEYADQKQTKDAIKKESTEKTKEAIKEAEETVKKLEKEKKVDQNQLAKRRMDIGKINPEVKKIAKDLKDFKESEDYIALNEEYKILLKEAKVTHSDLESYINNMIDMYGEEASTYLEDFLQRWKNAQEVVQDLMDKRSELINQQLVDEGFKLRKQENGRYVLDSKELNNMDLEKMKEISREILGDTNVEIMESILTPSEMDAMGRYMANWIQIRAGSIDKGSTFYHEAVHKALDIFLTPQEKALLIKEVRKIVGDKELKRLYGGIKGDGKYRSMSLVHGTKSEILNGFSLDTVGTGEGNRLDYYGIYFAQSYLYAEQFAKNQFGRDKAKVYEAGVNINPARMLRSTPTDQEQFEKDKQWEIDRKDPYWKESEQKKMILDGLMDKWKDDNGIDYRETGSNEKRVKQEAKYKEIIESSTSMKDLYNKLSNILGNKKSTSEFLASIGFDGFMEYTKDGWIMGIFDTGKIENYEKVYDYQQGMYRGGDSVLSQDDMAEEWLAENIIDYINKNTPKTFKQKIKATIDKFIDRWFKTMDNIDTIENFYKGLLSGRLLKRQIELQKQGNGNLKQIAGVPIVYQGLVKYKTEPTVINFLKDIKTLFKEATQFKTSEEFITSKFTEKPKYGMAHRPSYFIEDEGDFTQTYPSADNLLQGEILPRDVYEHPEWSLSPNHDDVTNQQSWKALLSIRNKPDKEITIYRATRKNELNIGDWVTFSKEYAKDSVEEGSGEQVYEFKVKAGDIVFAGDDVNEFGYYPKRTLEDIWKQANETPKYRADLLFDEEVEEETPKKPKKEKPLEITKTPEKGVVYDTKGTSILPSRKLQQQIEETLMSGQSTPATRSVTAFMPVIETAGKIKDSRAFEKIQDRYAEIQELDPSLNELKYKSMSIADITAKAMAFVDEYPAEARRVALGMELAPEGTTNIAVSLAYTEKMFEEGKWKQAREADRALSLRGTRLGQEIVSFKGRLNANSPMFFMEQVLNARRMVVSSRMFKSGSLENFAKMKQERMAEVAKTLKQIKLEKAEDFINKLIC